MVNESNQEQDDDTAKRALILLRVSTPEQEKGNGHRYYGYKYLLDERGKRTGFVLNHDVIFIDENGIEWTEVKVVTFIFESAAKGVAMRRICICLNEKHIPSPYVANWKSKTTGKVTSYPVYYCPSGSNSPGICKGCSIKASILDELAWEKVVEIINDPKEIDKRLEKERSADPSAERRKNLNAMLKKIRDEQIALQDFLSKHIKKRTLDSRTEARLTKELGDLAQQEEKCESMLAEDMNEYEKWKKIQKKLDELHQECTIIRERMRKSNYEPEYQKKRDLFAFFGITIRLFQPDHKPRIQLQCNPPDIVSLHPLVGRSDGPSLSVLPN